ncbi:uncharacterized protein LOC129913435 isoform X1 [Episyrphus balteatus]|uniref:uncharacterized protein LOC129913435 isoform X1 n=1 Tax=Episyrphus balteatus TaxID=286459 RepID=UPI00248622D3|nr:uncharacterized protein LOC129913435 isoform X1 [Episyrphus balteatus]
MGFRLFFSFLMLISLEFSYFVLLETCPTQEGQTSITELRTKISLESIDNQSALGVDSQSHSVENKLRQLRSTSAEEENSGEQKGPVEDIAAIKQIVDLLRNVGQRVIPIVMQGASVLNNLLSNLDA